MKPVLDISEFQTGIDYARAAQDISGVIIRCGGTGYGSAHSVYDDSMFETHYKGFRDQGVLVGAYFYAGAVTDAGVDAELAMCKLMLQGKDLALPVYYDVEVPSGNYLDLSVVERTRLALRWIHGIEEMGYSAGLYTYVSYVGRLDMDAFLLYPVWMAQYYSELEYHGHCELWQYTSDGDIDGYSGRVDLSMVLSDNWWEMQTYKHPDKPAEPKEPEATNDEEADDMARPVIGKGDKGPYVAAAQGLLEYNGYSLDYCGGCDGDFGEGTEYAVRCYQRVHGLEVDGVIGEMTWASLLS